jgi:solute carrier family 25 (mitochondrial folate transporter), member 32
MKNYIVVLVHLLLFVKTFRTATATAIPTNMIPNHTKATAATTASFLPTAATTSETNTTVPAVVLVAPPRNAGYIWSSLFAGVGSGALASIVCAPLDLLRTRMQVWGDVATHKEGAIYFLKTIRRTEGLRGYFRGLGATLATVPMFWGLYFPLYDDMKRTLSRGDPNRNPAVVHCMSAVSAGAIADIICNPMFVVRTRLQTEALHGNRVKTIRHTIRALYQEGGILIFWRGLTASMLGLSHVGVQFPVYEWLKRESRLLHDGTETPLDLLLASGLSKMTASLLTYPHEVVRSRMMDARVAAEASFANTCTRIWTHEGLAGFYSGLHISLIRVVPNCCVTFLTYELLLRFAKDNLLTDRKSK